MRPKRKTKDSGGDCGENGWGLAACGGTIGLERGKRVKSE
jgi:hypothetical protein